MIRTAQEALALVRRKKLLTMTPSEGYASLVAEVAGGPVRGSWWGHPKGALMYDLANRLHDSSEVLATRLVEGKVTFIHRSLWPALYRIVSDSAWRRSSLQRFDALERRILAAVEDSGQVESERLAARWGLTTPVDRKRFKKASDRLAGGMALLTSNVHTEKGSHASILLSWDRWAKPPLRRAARRIGFEEASHRIREACGGAPPGLALPVS